MSKKIVEPSVDFLTTGLVGPGVQKISLVRNDLFANSLKGKRAHERKPTRFSFVNLGAVYGNRTRVPALGRPCTTIVLIPPAVFFS